jgi:hypothetical protein
VLKILSSADSPKAKADSEAAIHSANALMIINDAKWAGSVNI